MKTLKFNSTVLVFSLFLFITSCQKQEFQTEITNPNAVENISPTEESDVVYFRPGKGYENKSDGELQTYASKNFVRYPKKSKS